MTKHMLELNYGQFVSDHDLDRDQIELLKRFVDFAKGKVISTVCISCHERKKLYKHGRCRNCFNLQMKPVI